MQLREARLDQTFDLVVVLRQQAHDQIGQIGGVRDKGQAQIQVGSRRKDRCAPGRRHRSARGNDVLGVSFAHHCPRLGTHTA
jgi:hypothetical protein